MISPVPVRTSHQTVLILLHVGIYRRSAQHRIKYGLHQWFRAGACCGLRFISHKLWRLRRKTNMDIKNKIKKLQALLHFCCVACHEKFFFVFFPFFLFFFLFIFFFFAAIFATGFSLTYRLCFQPSVPTNRPAVRVTTLIPLRTVDSHSFTNTPLVFLVFRVLSTLGHN